MFTQAVPTTRVSVDMTGFGASILEAATTLMVVFTDHGGRRHAACDPGPGGRQQGGRHRDADWAGPMASAALAALVRPASSLGELRARQRRDGGCATAQAQMPSLGTVK